MDLFMNMYHSSGNELREWGKTNKQWGLPGSPPPPMSWNVTKTHLWFMSSNLTWSDLKLLTLYPWWHMTVGGEDDIWLVIKWSVFCLTLECRISKKGHKIFFKYCYGSFLYFFIFSYCSCMKSERDILVLLVCSCDAGFFLSCVSSFKTGNESYRVNCVVTSVTGTTCSVWGEFTASEYVLYLAC